MFFLSFRLLDNFLTFFLNCRKLRFIVVIVDLVGILINFLLTPVYKAIYLHVVDPLSLLLQDLFHMFALRVRHIYGFNCLLRRRFPINLV